MQVFFSSWRESRCNYVPELLSQRHPSARGAWQKTVQASGRPGGFPMSFTDGDIDHHDSNPLHPGGRLDHAMLRFSISTASPWNRYRSNIPHSHESVASSGLSTALQAPLHILLDAPNEQLVRLVSSPHPRFHLSYGYVMLATCLRPLLSANI